MGFAGFPVPELPNLGYAQTDGAAKVMSAHADMVLGVKVMSMFLGLGFSLEQVVAMATINPAKVIDRLPGHGSLMVGAPGDATIMELVEAPIRFVDFHGNHRTGMASLQPVTTVTQGRVLAV